MYANWIAVVLCYNGLTLNGVNLGGSVHLNMALGVIVEVPSYIACIVTVDRSFCFGFHTVPTSLLHIIVVDIDLAASPCCC